MSHNPTPARVRISDGLCRVFFAFDVGHAIDLEAALRRFFNDIQPQRGTFSRPHRGPAYLQFKPQPLRLDLPVSALAIDSTASVRPSDDTITPTVSTSEATVEATLFDFGAVSLAYRIPLSGRTLDSLLELAAGLYESSAHRLHARRQVEELVSRLGDAISRPAIADAVEDYVVYHVRRWSTDTAAPTSADQQQPPSADVAALLAEGETLARILRGEPQRLSEQEVEEALACRLEYGRGDLTIIDWNAALVFDSEGDDTLAVLEFANVELLEMRVLDDQLDRVLDRAFLPFTNSRRRALRTSTEDRRSLAVLQMNAALLFEDINNAIKLVGDQYLARIYRLAARRFHLADWDASVLRKLETVQRLYEKLSDEQAARRMEVLEWIIIVLIAVSIAIPFLTGGLH